MYLNQVQRNQSYTILLLVIFFSLLLSAVCSPHNDPTPTPPHTHTCSLWQSSLSRWCVCGWCGCLISIQDGIHLEPRRTTDHDSPPPAGQAGSLSQERRRGKYHHILSPHNHMSKRREKCLYSDKRVFKTKLYPLLWENGTMQDELVGFYF